MLNLPKGCTFHHHLQQLPCDVSLSRLHTHTHITRALLTSSSHTLAHWLPFPLTSCLCVETTDNTGRKPLVYWKYLQKMNVKHWFAVGSISKNLRTGRDNWLTSHRMNLPHLSSSDWVVSGEEERTGELESVCVVDLREVFLSCHHLFRERFHKANHFIVLSSKSLCQALLLRK